MKEKLKSLFLPPKLWVLLFFVAYFFVGIWIVRDFGISWDEKVQRGTGAVSLKYVLEIARPGYVQAHPELASLPKLMEYQDRDYGPAFEMFLIVAEKAMGLQEDTPSLFYMRHLFTFLFFFLSVFFFFLLLKKRFRSDVWALAGTALLVLSPRIFADSFYNSKDLVFLSAFTIGLFFLFQFLENKSVRNAILFGLTAALATDIRVIGIILPVTAMAFLCWEWLTKGFEKEHPGSQLRGVLTFFVAFTLFLIVMWPFLWPNPPGHFFYALKSMSKFRWEGKVFFMGQLFNGNELPFYYVPVWIAISTPLLTVLAFFPGMVTTVGKMVRNKLKLYSDVEGRMDVIAFFLFAAPLLATIVLGSTLYSGWRQLYFIYPAFLIIAMAGLHAVFLSQKNQKLAVYLVSGLVAVQCLGSIYSLVKMHPYGNVYFNFLGGSQPGEKFEMDYWGLAYRKGLEEIVRTNSAPEIFIKVESYPGKVNLSMLNPSDQSRIKYVESADSADYYLGAKPMKKYSGGKEIYSVAPNGWKILSVWKLK